MPGEPDALYVAARRALLDALEALSEHRRSVVLVGAQAIYLITGEGDLAVAPFTTDNSRRRDWPGGRSSTRTKARIFGCERSAACA